MESFASVPKSFPDRGVLFQSIPFRGSGMVFSKPESRVHILSGTVDKRNMRLETEKKIDLP